MADSITVANKIKINEANRILIPGTEPISELTSFWLAKNMHYTTSEICVKDALRLIPGSHIEINPFDPTMRWFVLPDGPPPNYACPCHWDGDWYAYLREAVTEESAKKPVDPPRCNAEGFNFGWCSLPENDKTTCTSEAKCKPILQTP